MAGRQIPKRCPECGHKTMALAQVPYEIQIDHDGRKYQISIPDLSVIQCGNCSEIVVDDVADERISEVFREKAGLLTPAQIKNGREFLGYNQQEFAKVFGVAVSTLSRWENGGQIQQRFHDAVLRAFFKVPAFREFMEKFHGIAQIGMEREGQPPQPMAIGSKHLKF